MIVDRLGQRFGSLQVFAKADVRKRTQFWSCRCDCGSVIEVGNNSLQSGNTTSCGCSRRRPRPAAIKSHACRFCGVLHAARLLSSHEATCDGRPKPSPRLQSDVEYLASRTRSNANGCVEWTGATGSSGYGICSRGGRKVPAHHLAYEVFHSAVPHHLCVSHKCGNPRCCNPEHLFLDTYANNTPLNVVKRNQAHTSSTNNARSTQTPASIRAIRTAAANGVDLWSLASQFGLSYHGVWDIVKRRSWKNMA